MAAKVKATRFFASLRMIRVCFLAVTALAVVLLGGSAQAAWIWTPEAGRWFNPERQPKETAALQFQYAEELLAKGETEKAVDEYRKVLRYFPESNYCDLAQYSIGRALEAEGEYEDAVKEYQKVINEYPNTQLFSHVLEKQRKIGDHFFDLGVEREEKFILWRGSNFDKAIETYRQVIDNQPFTGFSAEAQYRIGMCYMKLELYDEASAEFQKVIDYYPASKWIAESAYGTAECKLAQTLPDVYDKTAVDEAIQKYRFFLKAYPESEHAEEARKKLGELRETAAEHEFRIGMYYHYNMKYDSARLYFDSIIGEYPETQCATKCRETLNKMP
ncbi:outer membrane protein assembly factor BamD [Candidatus Poribacteria bacterium]|nr:outer membrane protein assembly factor BamD [Candidatus Poribacteria bacterium]